MRLLGIDEARASGKTENLTFSYTIASWGFGFEVGFPSRSQTFFLGTKLQCHFSLTVYVGPFTVEWRRPPTVIEYETPAVQQFYED